VAAVPESLRTLEIYCHQMGMVIQLSYCVSMNEGLPCRNTVRCWDRRTDIHGLLSALFSEEDLRKAFGGPPKSRLERIVESVEKSKTAPPDNCRRQ
jgi:hypothetical protein